MAPANSINLSDFHLEIADTPEKRILGLSGRTSLADNKGMLFVLETPTLAGIWMKDMNFPIDIIWLDENKIIVHVKENALPESYPDKFVPPVPAKYVIEVSAGLAQSRSLEIGIRVEW